MGSQLDIHYLTMTSPQFSQIVAGRIPAFVVKNGFVWTAVISSNDLNVMILYVPTASTKWNAAVAVSVLRGRCVDEELRYCADVK